MPTRTIGLVAALTLCGAALAADQPEAVYGKMHAAALARNVGEMRLYAAEAQRAGLAVPDLPKTYRVTGKAVGREGNAVELRAAGTADSVGLGYTQMFGVIDLVREKDEWKVERFSWSTERPGEYPEGFVVVEGAKPEPHSSAEAPRFKPPASPPERSHLINPRRPDEAKPQERPALQRTPPPCEIKPVMTDEELGACGATVPESR